MKKNVRQQELAIVRTAVFLTPTTLGMGIYHTGMKKSVLENNRRAFVLQGFMPMEPFRECIPGQEERASETIEELFHELLHWSGSVNHLVVYAGAHGFESAIMLAAKFSQEYTTIVGCPCDAHRKTDSIVRGCFKKLRIERSECGGWETMERLFHGFLDTGLPILNLKE